MRQTRVVRKQMTHRRKARTPSGPTQRMADKSVANGKLAQLQKAASATLQRADDETEAAAPEPVPVILSVENGMIGSIYFETGRIRLTHGAGPEDERGHEMIERYNIDKATAETAHQNEMAAGQHDGLTDFNYWVSDRLWYADEDDLPDWVIAKIDSVDEMAEGAAPAGAELFENFGELNEKTDEWDLAAHHPSRGAAVKERIAAGDLAAIEAALQVAKKGSEKEKNHAFFRSMLENAPEFALRMRTPEEVCLSDAKTFANFAEEYNQKLVALTGRLRPDMEQGELAAVKRDINEFAATVVYAVDTGEEYVKNAGDGSYREGLKPKAAVLARANKAQADARALLPRLLNAQVDLDKILGALAAASHGQIKKPKTARKGPVDLLL